MESYDAKQWIRQPSALTRYHHHITPAPAPVCNHCPITFFFCLLSAVDNMTNNHLNWVKLMPPWWCVECWSVSWRYKRFYFVFTGGLFAWSAATAQPQQITGLITAIVMLTINHCCTLVIEVSTKFRESFYFFGAYLTSNLCFHT